MKVAQVGRTVYSLQPIEMDGKAISGQLAIENKRSALAKCGEIQDDTGREILIGILTTKPVQYLEPNGLLYLSQHYFVVGLDTFLPAQQEVSKVPAVQVPPQNIQRDLAVGGHRNQLFATEAQHRRQQI